MSFIKTCSTCRDWRSRWVRYPKSKTKWILPLFFAAASSLNAQPPQPGKQGLDIRGQRQDVYCYPGASSPAKGKILFLPGDGGWRGFAVSIAETLSSSGYDICGMDTKRYLESFTGKTTLKETDVMADLRTTAAWMRGQSPDKVIYLGWSEGANLGVLGTAPAENKGVFKGFVAVGLSEAGILGWRWQDNITYVTKKEPDEPRYQIGPYVPKIAPLPFFMIHSSQDEYTAAERARKLFGAAGDPKRFHLVEAQNHRFDGNRDDFFRALKEGLEWVSQTAR